MTGRRWWPEPHERMPVDVLPVSNGEHFPPPPTPEQREIMAAAEREGERLRRRMGLSRRQFVRTAAATAVGLWAIDAVRPGRFGHYATANPIAPDACDLEFVTGEGLESVQNLPGEFIFDVQSHHVDPEGLWRVTNPAMHAFFAAVWPQSRPGSGGGELDPIANLGRFHYLKELFLDSATSMTVLSCVPTSPDTNNPLPLAEAAETVYTVNGMANSPRSVMHAFVMPNRGSGGNATPGMTPVFLEEELDLMMQRAQQYRGILRGWKTYCPWGDVPNASGWFLDDDTGMAFLEQVRAVSAAVPEVPPVVASHKGFALPGFDQRSATSRDVGPAAKAFPDIRFLIYHSGFDTGDRQKPYRGDEAASSDTHTVDGLIKSLRENDYDATRFIPPDKAFGNVPNVYAELGSVWRAVMNDPDQATHLLGKLVTYVGPRRVVWGTDSLWFGSPQSEIVALRAFQLSGKAREMYDLPYGLDGDRFDPRVNAMDAGSYRRPHRHVKGWPTDGRAHPERTIRNGIFGRNAAVPYGVDPDAARHKIACDDLEKVRESYLLRPTSEREVAPAASNLILGPRNRQQTLAQTWPHVPWAP